MSLLKTTCLCYETKVTHGARAPSVKNQGQGLTQEINGRVCTWSKANRRCLPDETIFVTQSAMENKWSQPVTRDQ